MTEFSLVDTDDFLLLSYNKEFLEKCELCSEEIPIPILNEHLKTQHHCTFGFGPNSSILTGTGPVKCLKCKYFVNYPNKETNFKIFKQHLEQNHKSEILKVKFIFRIH